MRSADGPKQSGQGPRYEEFEALLASLQADACLIGLFSRQNVLAVRPWVVMHNMRAGDLSGHAMYHLLFGGTFPGFQSSYSDHLLDRTAFMRGVLLKRGAETAGFEAAAGKRLLEALRLAMEPERALSLVAGYKGRVALERRQSDQIGIVLLDNDFTIRERWMMKTTDGLLELSGSLFPLYIEEQLLMQARFWKWKSTQACEPIAFSPVPDFLVRAYPTEREGRVHAIVTIEQVQVRVALDRAQREHHLSPRETEVLRYLFEGYRVEEIAKALSVAESTVQDHIKRAISKAGARNRMQLAARILGWDIATSRR